MSPSDPVRGERWTICSQNHIHWGANGGAGLLLRHKPGSGNPTYLLARRSRSVDEGGTWGIPGGAVRHGERPEATARREAIEEIGQLPCYDVTAVEVQDCGGGWLFHIIMGDVKQPFVAYSQQETQETGWFTLEQLRGLQLHPGIRRWLDHRNSAASGP